MMAIIRNEPIQSLSTGISVLSASVETSLHVTWTQCAIYYPSAAMVVVAERTCEDEKQAFQSALPTLRSRYAGEWVAFSGGEVVGHDRDRRAVTRRFFETRTMRRPVYIGFVGPTKTVRQATPFRARPRA